ncbi:dCTP deaminase [Dehalococcoidia bacterium]|nr:dCTP deaminase [Dehalococcoidia bacterium]
MILSDRTIKAEIARGRLIIDPLDPSCIQPASVDVRLDKGLLICRTKRHEPYIDLRQGLDDLNQLVELEEDEPFLLEAGGFVLVSTLELIGLPDDIVARLEGKSSLARIGLLAHSTAGYVDPGWRGHLTLHVSNLAKFPVTLYYGMKIGQISFLRLTSPAENLYGSSKLGSKYQGQTGPTASRYHHNFEANQQ